MGKIKKIARNPVLIWSIIRWWLRELGAIKTFALPQPVAGLLSPAEVDYLYKKARNSAVAGGNILDFGSHMGLSTCIFATLAGPLGGRVYSFDTFSGLPEPSSEDKDLFKKGEMEVSEKTFRENIKKCGAEDIVTLSVGDCRETFPEKVRSGEITGFCFAFLDLDLYDPIKKILLELDKIAQGKKTILIHDVYSEGVMQAIKEFMAESKHKTSFRKDWIVSRNAAGSYLINDIGVLTMR